MASDIHRQKLVLGMPVLSRNLLSTSSGKMDSSTCIAINLVLSWTRYLDRFAPNRPHIPRPEFRRFLEHSKL